MTDQVQEQQLELAEQFRKLSTQVAQQPSFDNHVVLHVSTRNDYEPINPFLRRDDPGYHANLITFCPFCRSSYLVEMKVDQLERYADHLKNTTLITDQEDISHIESVCFIRTKKSSSADRDKIWEVASETDGECRIFDIDLMPLKSCGAAEDLIKKFTDLRDDVFRSTELLDKISPSSQFAEGIEFAIERYLRCPSHAPVPVTAPVWSRESLDQLVASGTVLNIEPNNQLNTTD